MIATAFDAVAGLQDGIEAYNVGNYKQAKTLLEPYAEKGNANAQYFLARAHYDDRPSVGWIVAKWFGKAADQGHGEAQYWYGFCWETGKGLRRNYAKAKHYYELAAKQGNPSAVYRLGLMYENGRGVEKSNSRAVALYERAASMGHETARDQLFSLRGMSGNQQTRTPSTSSDSLRRQRGPRKITNAVIKELFNRELNKAYNLHDGVASAFTGREDTVSGYFKFHVTSVTASNCTKYGDNIVSCVVSYHVETAASDRVTKMLTGVANIKPVRREFQLRGDRWYLLPQK